MQNLNQWLGRYGEDQALEYLRGLGYEILERNWRGKQGEIDLVAKDRGRFVFVEVKTRSGTRFGHPFESITGEKLARMRRVALEWCETNQIPKVKIRLDAISVLVHAGRVSVEHLKQVF
jgi:putative endonuclease